MEIRELINLSPNEAASKLLTHHGGVQRNAEAEAWHFQDQFHPQGQQTEYKFFGATALSIFNGTEYPPVERRVFVFTGTADMVPSGG